MVRRLVLVAALLVPTAAHTQSPTPATPANGTIVAQTPCTFTDYDQTSAFTRRYYSRAEYTSTIGNTAVECLRIQYASDGLKVVGFLVKPRTTGTATYPVIVYNRGGFRDIGKLDAWNLLDFYGFASQGFVVLASQYRGNDGGEGRDEIGGADVADVMALAQLTRQLPYADASNVFLYGLSRGAMMSFLALKRGFPAKAAAVVGALIDLEAAGKRSPQVLASAGRSIPNFASDAATIVRERSVMNWPEQVGVPVLILHGADDQEVPATEAMAFATRLAELHKRYQLIVYAGDVHEVAVNRLDRDARIVAWFKDVARSKQ
jgi:dipeptidyl aminopeptidase/acylaminoacyl peptidase